MSEDPLRLLRVHGPPMSYGVLSQSNVGQMRGRCGTDACLHRGSRSLAAANAFQPIAQMEHFAVRLVVKVGAFWTRAQHPLHLRFGGELGIAIEGVTVTLGNYFQAATIQIERGFRAHEFEHGAVPRVHKGRLKVDLSIWIL